MHKCVSARRENWFIIQEMNHYRDQWSLAEFELQRSALLSDNFNFLSRIFRYILVLVPTKGFFVITGVQCSQKQPM